MIHIDTCPHCLTKKIALVVVKLVPVEARTANIFLDCPNCRYPICARTLYPARELPDNYIQKTSTTEALDFLVGPMWPMPKEPNIPDSVPDGVARALKQAETNFFSDGHEEAAAVMYRKALELALRAVDPTLSGMLAKRIELLGDQGKLTADLVSWAKEIKNLGNDGAHDEVPIERSELEALRGLTEMVLRYLFTLPQLVKARRANKQLGAQP